MIHGGGKCKDETLENFPAMKRTRGQHVESGDRISFGGYYIFEAQISFCPSSDLLAELVPRICEPKLLVVVFCRFVCLLALGRRVYCYLQLKEERNVWFVPHLLPLLPQHIHSAWCILST